MIFRARPAGAGARRTRDRLKLVHTLTREPEPQRHGPDVRAGPREHGAAARGDPRPHRLPGVRLRAGHHGVGPQGGERETGVAPAPRFLESALESLKEIGVKPDQITRESYG